MYSCQIDLSNPIVKIIKYYYYNNYKFTTPVKKVFN